MNFMRQSIIVFWVLAAVADAAEPQPVSKANYDQAFKYSNEYLRQFVYSTGVTPGWVGKSDSFWYSYRTSQGTRYWRVNAKDGKKEPLFDANALAAKLSEMQKKPIDAATLPLTRISLNDDGTKMKFVTDDLQFEYEFAANKLANLGKAPPAPPTFPGRRGMSDYWAERYHGLKEVPLAKDPPRKDDPKRDDKATGAGGKPDAAKTATAAKKDDEANGADKPSIASVTAVKFEIKVPTNAELATNLKGALLLVHGEADNNVHPANTMRLVDALIKANKRFDMLILPGKRHAYGDYQPYFTQRMWDFFCEHLLNDRPTGADILDKHLRGPK